MIFKRIFIYFRLFGFFQKVKNTIQPATSLPGDASPYFEKEEERSRALAVGKGTYNDEGRLAGNVLKPTTSAAENKEKPRAISRTRFEVLLLDCIFLINGAKAR